MPEIDLEFICHRLSIESGEEKRRATREEIKKLLAVGFIREIQYPTWLANVVMVKKANEKWRMCTDYTDLNKACPKDPYPLPSIDRLVDGTLGYAQLSFMDAYLGYNQIKMHPQDESKTAFITDAGAYYYKVMPFGFKNAGATYQRLMDRIFEGLIGGDVEEYVDDMVVKLVTVADHYRALRRAKKFLGFMLTERGIEANPEKCQVIINIRSPQTQLIGRITTLSRFVSRSIETAIPIFNSLKKGGSFTWTTESEEAFLRLKALLATPSTLMKPTSRIPLLIYILVADEAVSVAMVQEREGKQHPIYFISKVLQNAEKRYQRIEKEALALVVASRRLRHFQGYSIIVRTDLPIKQVLRKPDLAEWMVTWSVQLSEFDISYERRGHVKA
ncbi:Retrovirus-related Pol polyprotein from transposon 17.6, partial [Mucuna pruriens]